MKLAMLCLSCLALLASDPLAPSRSPEGFPLQDSAPKDPARRLQEATRQLAEEQAPWYEDFRAARTEEERQRLLDEVPGRVFVELLRSIAEDARGTGTGLDAWTRLYGLGKELRDEAVADGALEHIVGGYLDSPRLEGFCGFVSSWARPGKTSGSIRTLRTIFEGSPHRKVQAAALHTLAVILAQEEQEPQGREEARALFGQLRDSYADLGGWKQLAEAGLFELEHLQVDMQAPDFEAVDQTGTSFRLSESLGRVVLIDFWGSW